MRRGSARASDIAEAAGVQRSTVTRALRSLRILGHIKYEPYSPITLTELELAEGKGIYHRHQVLREFFVKLLLLDEETAQDTAGRLEHDMPDEVILRLGQYMRCTWLRTEKWMQAGLMITWRIVRNCSKAWLRQAGSQSCPMMPPMRRAVDEYGSYFEAIEFAVFHMDHEADNYRAFQRAFRDRAKDTA